MEVKCVSVKSYFIQYRFIMPSSIKHSSYTYQKVFRAIYGYTQSVYKANGKVYHYHRSGVLSNFPYIRPGKNCVIIPISAFPMLKEFFKSGKNPAHNWTKKGDWKCTYFMDEKNLDEKEVINSLEQLISKKILSGTEGPIMLFSELKRALNEDLDSDYVKLIINEAKPIVNLDWFREFYSQSPILTEFYSIYKKLNE